MNPTASRGVWERCEETGGPSQAVEKVSPGGSVGFEPSPSRPMAASQCRSAAACPAGPPART
jgi:hypothetical protein